MSGHPDQLVARYSELVRLNKLVRDLAIGNGSVVLVEGEPGVGKTAVVDSALHGSALAGCQVLRTVGDPLTEPLPLRMILKCLRVEELPAGPERAGLSALLGSGEPGSAEVLSGDGIVAAVERVIVLIERLSAAAPLIVVLDDLQWADDATLRLCQRLASMIKQLRVLLVGVSLPVPRKPALTRLRQSIKDLAASGHAELLTIPPLPQDAVDELVGRVVGAPPGPRLRALVTQAAGNPLYVREILHALTREHVLDRDAQMVEARHSAAESLPDSLIATIDGRLDFLSAATMDLLRMAALLGIDFAVEDLTVVLGKPPAEFIEGVEEAMAASVLTESDLGLRFRHGLIQLACYNRIPRSLRIPLHRQAARALSDSGAPLARVAEQVIPSARLVDRWLLDWLSANLGQLTVQAPQPAADLMRNTIRAMGSNDPRYGLLVTGLVRAEFMLGNNAEVLAVADTLLASVADAEFAAEISWFACHACLRKGLLADGLRVVRQARAAADPGPRLLRLLRVANATLCAATGDFDDAHAILDEVFATIETGQAHLDDFLPGYAMFTSALVMAYQGNYGPVPELLDRGLAALAANPMYRDLRLAMRFDRLLALQHLDRLPDTELVAGVVRDIEKSGSSLTAVTHAMVAELYLRSGRWTEALTEIESAGDTGDTEMAELLCGGISAYVSAHRGDWSSAHRALAALAGYGLSNVQQRHDGGYVLMARAAAAEHDRGAAEALAVLVPTLDPGIAAGYHVRHLWRPDIIRLALLTGDRALAEASVLVAEQEAATEPSSKAKAITARRCRALVEADTVPLLAAARYHQSVRQLMEAARSLEDAAVVAVANGDSSTARTAFTQAVELYSDLGAEWDLRRLDGRMRKNGLRRGRRTRPSRPATGWESLTPTELKIAGMIATGCSNPDIAAEFYLSRRTVETHVSHILTKIDGRSRTEIAREVVRHSSHQPA